MTAVAYEVKPRKVGWVSILGIGLMVVSGVLRAAITHNLGFGFGDQSTFLIFARSLLRGEAIYKDFIHFRTPGFYFLSAVFLRVFGPTLSSEMLAGAVESFVLYPLIFYFCAYRIFRKHWVALILGLICVGMPGILQLRTGLGLLAITLYAASEVTDRWRQRLLTVGAAIGLDFVFGQEVAIFAAICIGLWEIKSYWQMPKLLVNRLGFVALGGFVALLPLLIYVVGFSSLRNFLYYVFTYAFVLQPKGMNVPFPHFDYINIVYYLPFVLYLASFANFYFTKRLNRLSVVLLSFGATRLISALGRADMAHLLFAIPELFIIFPLSLVGVDQLSLNRERIWRFLVLAAALVVIFGLSIKVTSSLMLLAPVVFVLSAVWSEREKSSSEASTSVIRNYFGLMTAMAAVLLFMFVPLGLEAVHTVAHGLRPSKQAKISGVRVTEQEKTELETVQKAIMKIHPDTLFSFPIEPFYYSLVPHHASRFLTYEFQTTGQEQTETISDLEKNKPQMVIFDMLQAEGLSGSVNRISDYVTTHYRTVQSVSVINYLKMMVPRDVPVLEQHLAFHIYQNNYRDKKTIDGYHIDNHDGTITDGIIMRGVSSRFNLAIDQSAVLIAGVTAEPGSTDVSERCGQITIQAASANISRRVCASDGQQSIDLAEFVGRAAMITLTRLSDLPIVWIDPTIKAAVNVGVKP